MCPRTTKMRRTTKYTKTAVRTLDLLQPMANFYRRMSIMLSSPMARTTYKFFLVRLLAPSGSLPKLSYGYRSSFVSILDRSYSFRVQYTTLQANAIRYSSYRTASRLNCVRSIIDTEGLKLLSSIEIGPSHPQTIHSSWIS